MEVNALGKHQLRLQLYQNYFKSLPSTHTVGSIGNGVHCKSKDAGNQGPKNTLNAAAAVLCST
jgi:hypothetical protein